MHYSMEWTIVVSASAWSTAPTRSERGAHAVGLTHTNLDSGSLWLRSRGDPTRAEVPRETIIRIPDRSRFRTVL